MSNQLTGFPGDVEIAEASRRTSGRISGYVIALAILVWGITFATMNIFWMIGSLLVALVLGAIGFVYVLSVFAQKMMSSD